MPRVARKPRHPYGVLLQCGGCQYVGSRDQVYGHRAASANGLCMMRDPVEFDMEKVLVDAGVEFVDDVPATPAEVEDPDDQTLDPAPEQNGNGRKPRQPRTPQANGAGRLPADTYEMARPNQGNTGTSHWEEPPQPKIRVSGDVDFEVAGLYAYARRDPDLAFEGDMIKFMSQCTVAYFEILRRRLVVVDYSAQEQQQQEVV